jgi:maltose alpha-D-glucosyltransferase/alpha-amylase
LALAAELTGARRALLGGVARMAQAGLGSLCTRIHGDLHLGQILIAQGDAYFVDFEGEPAKPLAQRRQRLSPLRDVAGMLRSFAYVTAMATHTGPGDLTESARAHRDTLLERFLPRVQETFLAAYWEASAGIPHRFGELADRDVLLELFTLEKAAYEVCYESANRPSWLGVPLRGLAALARPLLQPGKPHD